MKNLWTIVITVVAILNLALLTVLVFAFDWTIVLMIVGFSIPTAAVLLGLSYVLYRLTKKKWIYAYVPSLAVILLGLILEIIFAAWNVFPGLSGLVPTIIVFVGLTGSVMTLVSIKIIAFLQTRPNKKA